MSASAQARPIKERPFPSVSKLESKKYGLIRSDSAWSLNDPNLSAPTVAAYSSNAISTEFRYPPHAFPLIPSFMRSFLSYFDHKCTISRPLQPITQRQTSKEVTEK